MTTKIGNWIDVDTSQVIPQVSGKPPGHHGVTVSPSPYDVPLAFRVVEGDPADPAFSVEVRYLGGSERTKVVGSGSNFELQVGEKSGRLYRVFVNSKLAKEGARIHMGSLAKAIDELRSHTPLMSRKTNYELVRRIVEANGVTIVTQLKGLASEGGPEDFGSASAKAVEYLSGAHETAGIAHKR